jgi:hypothetical protein
MHHAFSSNRRLMDLNTLRGENMDMRIDRQLESLSDPLVFLVFPCCEIGVQHISATAIFHKNRRFRQYQRRAESSMSIFSTLLSICSLQTGDLHNRRWWPSRMGDLMTRHGNPAAFALSGLLE